jgi:chemotaxis regulatin CheY-phosphate phosphatase CheZ
MSDAARKIDQDEYDAIERAVLETPRGRWFLQEFARRNRMSGTEEVIGAIERLYDLARETAAEARYGFLYHEMQEMRRAMSETRAAIAAVKPGERHNIPASNDDLAAVAEAADRASRDVVEAAERLQDIADTLRKAGADADLCDEIETHASGIFMASAYQEMTGKRIALVVEALEKAECHVANCISLWEEEARKA